MWKVIGSRQNKSICSISSVLCVQKLFRDVSAHYLHSTLWPEVFSCIFLHMKDMEDMKDMKDLTATGTQAHT